MPEYNKLVRDGIPRIIAERNVHARYRHLEDDEEYRAALVAKLLEECLEYRYDPTSDELADVLEVIAALRQFHPDVDVQRELKWHTHGGFDKRVFLISAEDEG